MTDYKVFRKTTSAKFEVNFEGKLKRTFLKSGKIDFINPQK
jgi:hypothetical protein